MSDLQCKGEGRISCLKPKQGGGVGKTKPVQNSRKHQQKKREKTKSETVKKTTPPPVQYMPPIKKNQITAPTADGSVELCSHQRA